MIQNHNDPKRYLYHYTSIEKATNYILKNWSLRVSPILKTNDPKENLSWSFNLHSPSFGDVGNPKWNTVSGRLSDVLKDNSKVLGFCQDDADLSGNHMDDNCKRGFCKPRMWAQYGDNHSGVCLVIDFQKFVSAFKSYLGSSIIGAHRSIEYVNRSHINGSEGDVYSIDIDYIEVNGFDPFVIAYLKQCYKKLFFEKMTDWQGEREYRFWVFYRTDQEILIDIRDSLVGVMFGTSTKTSDIKSVLDLLKGKAVQKMKIDWKNHVPWYNFANPLFR